jgi:hypothetical protein
MNQRSPALDQEIARLFGGTNPAPKTIDRTDPEKRRPSAPNGAGQAGRPVLTVRR